VTSDDVIASLRRWAQRDNMGLVLLSFVDRWEAIDDITFRIVLKKPYGMMLETLGKVVGSAPFIMPKHVASTPMDKQIADTTGSALLFSKETNGVRGKRSFMSKTGSTNRALSLPTEPPVAR